MSSARQRLALAQPPGTRVSRRALAAAASLTLAVGALAAATPTPAEASAMPASGPGVTAAAALSDPYGQKLTVTGFTTLTSALSGLRPAQVADPGWREVFDRTARYFTPASPPANAWVHVQGQANRDVKLTASSSLVNKSTFAPVYSFKVRFPQPVADPKLDVQLQNTSWYRCASYSSCATLLSTVGSRIEFSGALGSGADQLRGVTALSGVSDVPSSRYRVTGTAIQNDGYGCYQNGTGIARGVGSFGCYNNASYSSQVRNAVGSSAGDLGYDLAGTIQLDTGGAAVSEVTVTYLGRFAFPQWNSRIVTLPSISFAYAGSAPVSSDNLRIAKSVIGGATARSGEYVTYALTLANTDGRPTSAPVQLTDTLPAQLTDAELVFPPSVGTATITGTTLTWAIPQGTSTGSTLQLRARVRDGAASGTATNTATLSGLCGSQCTATATSQIVSDPAQLRLTKTAPATVGEGGSLTYRLTLSNAGGEATTGPAVIIDDLPAGLDPMGATASASLGTVTVSGARVTWLVPAGFVPADPRTAQLVVTAPVRADAGTWVTNTAQIAAGPCDAACTATATTSVTGAGRIALTKSNSLGAATGVTPGQAYRYTITATNTGTGTLRGITLSDELIASLEFAAANQDGWQLAGQRATSTPFDLAPGGSREFSLTVRVKASATAGTVLPNTAVALGFATDAQCAAEPARAGCAADPLPPRVLGSDVHVAKSNNLGGATRVTPAQQFSYTITATNRGSATAGGVRLIDELPDGLEFASANQDGWTITGTRATSVPFDLAPGAVKQLTLFVQVSQHAADGTLLRNAVVAAGGPSREQCQANAAMAGCGVDPQPPTVSTAVLTITKKSDVDSESEIPIGAVVTYTITVANSATVAISGVRIQDWLPTALAFAPANQPGWTISGRTATSDLFRIEGGATLTFTVTAVAVSPTSLKQRNIAMITESGAFGKAAAVRATAESAALQHQRCDADPTADRCAYADVRIAAPADQAPAPTAQPTPTTQPTPTPAATNRGVFWSLLRWLGLVR